MALDEHIRKIDALDCSDRTKRRRKQQTSQDTFKAGDVSLRQNLNAGLDNADSPWCSEGRLL